MEQYASHVDENLIRAKAHQLWVQRGCPQNSADEDWFEAERLLLTERGSGSADNPRAASKPDSLEKERAAPAPKGRRRA